jgi:phosphohistidine swiveling domain-containing protein
LPVESIIGFDDPSAVELAFAGGKGANLARLVQAGFDVPGGFLITTGAYREFLTSRGLQPQLETLLESINTDQPDKLDACAASIRNMIETATMPDALAAKIRSAYADTCGGRLVAVRSSGTAEDLQGASFAGLHDTYLDVRGAEDVLAAVQRCWASLWTTRATAYRAQKGFDSATLGMCVIVQAMVESEVSGVMFSGNPLNAATEEILINASWGLGEAVVQGITTPDSFIVKSGNLRIRSHTLGAKEIQIVRDPDVGSGTVTQPVGPQQQAEFTLNDAAVRELAAVGCKVQDYYEGLPQDVEWAYADGQFLLLQSRPITGVDFSWDADVDAYQPTEEQDGEYWSRTWADEGWTGAITPLFYSMREQEWRDNAKHWATIKGKYDELATFRQYKFHRSEVYWNLRYEKALTIETFPPPFRKLGVWTHLPAEMLESTFEKPFDWLGYAKMYVGNLFGSKRDGFWSWDKYMKKNFYDNEEATRYADGPSNEELGLLSDAQLKRVLKEYVDHEIEYGARLWGLAFFYFRDVLCVLHLMLNNWYDGDANTAFSELLSGSPERTPTIIENHELWLLSQKIRTSPTLSELVSNEPPEKFFLQLPNSEDGKEFLAEYQEFVNEHPHRGHGDRDIYYARRCEDPTVDFNTLRAYMAIDVDPAVHEAEVNRRREARVAEVFESIKTRSLGGLKAQSFMLLMDWVRKFVVWRDVERNFGDRSTFTLKRISLEVNRRLMDRGLVETERDFYFLSFDELFQLLNGGANTTLTKAKISARMRNFDRFLKKEWAPPMYTQDGLPVDLDAEAVDEVDGVFGGAGYSSGTVTGKARIIKTQQELGKLEKGEILVCNATDPGWTSAFNIIIGIVTETGGALAHAACLAREYGLPGVQVSNAMQKIPDGATITVDGAAGRVTVEDSASELEAG